MMQSNSNICSDAHAPTASTRKGRGALRFCYTWLACLCLMACSTQYNINGDSSVSTLDGRMLYLKAVTQDNSMENIDSCEVVHGKFTFMGTMDSICMGELTMDNISVMPVVIENGDVNIFINEMEQRVVGGSLNNKLYQFLNARNQLENEIMELSSQEARAILSGNSSVDLHFKLQEKMDKVYAKIERLEANFVIDNSDNILGRSFFMELCNRTPGPMLTPQMKQILKKAPAKFLRQPFVENYVRAAEANHRFIRQMNSN
ncbi:MAG: DUF4369 domain-containing protein [Bacteroidaceae bacterium]|nr:DUF4369 domain-containing protein [Bacteroidaceae bacterium]